MAEALRSRFLDEVFQHQAVIHRICALYRDDPDDRQDLFQEIIYQLWKAYPQFQGRSKVTTWMYRIGLNTALASFRKPSLAKAPLNEGLERLATAPQEEDEQTRQLFWAIKQMNAADRSLIALYLEDLSYKEIASIVGISENYVGVRLNRIKEKIKKLINPPS